MRFQFVRTVRKLGTQGKQCLSKNTSQSNEDKKCHMHMSKQRIVGSSATAVAHSVFPEEVQGGEKQDTGP